MISLILDLILHGLSVFFLLWSFKGCMLVFC